eukprot:13066382-Alexandrium_andersonii.AAC.1
MSASLVGSEMCIRDSLRCERPHRGSYRPPGPCRKAPPVLRGRFLRVTGICLLYTSDAADDM